MPQTANSCHIYIRRGGYEPSFSLHTTKNAADAFLAIETVIDNLVAIIPNTCTVTRVEYQLPNGHVEAELLYPATGTHGGEPAAFEDCTYLRWISAGPKNASGCYIHPRPYNSFQNGLAYGAWGAALDAWLDVVTAGNWTDSEGYTITGVSRARPSRRRRVRVAP